MRGIRRSLSNIYELDGLVVLSKKTPLLGALLCKALDIMKSWGASELVAPLNRYGGSISLPPPVVLVSRGEVIKSNISETQTDSEVIETNPTASVEELFLPNTYNSVRKPDRLPQWENDSQSESTRGTRLKPLITKVVIPKKYSRSNLISLLKNYNLTKEFNTENSGIIEIMKQTSGILEILKQTHNCGAIWQQLANSGHFKKGLNSLAKNLGVTSVEVESAKSLGGLIGRINDWIYTCISKVVEELYPSAFDMINMSVQEVFEAIEGDLLLNDRISLATTRSILTKKFAQQLEDFISRSQADMENELGGSLTLNHFPRWNKLLQEVYIGLNRSMKNVEQLQLDYLNSSDIPETIPTGVKKTICQQIKSLFERGKGVKLTDTTKATITKKLDDLQQYCAVQSVLVPLDKYLEKIKSLNAGVQPSSRTMELVMWLLNFILLGGYSSIGAGEVVADVTASLGEIIDMDFVIGDIYRKNSVDFKMNMYSMPNHKYGNKCFGVFSDANGSFAAVLNCSSASLSSGLKNFYEKE